MSEVALIAVDPGREKCGVAALSREGDEIKILKQEVISTETLGDVVARYAEKFSCGRLVIGNGTTSGNAVMTIQNAAPMIEIIVVDEYRTTDDARREYWRANPPSGWRRLLPTTMMVPPRPVDDFVAVILGTRFLLAHSSQAKK
ncbi:MAG: pre-16S rRNA-processing nuclease YqgF [Schwartzia sp.]|nr:pre-16S rRNA-processing nuclease YqgF [Schwartzia sp. (in: firmicutes)]